MAQQKGIFRVNGSGLPLVLVHGFALDQQIWDAVRTELGKEYTVYTCDLPGFGQAPAEDFRGLAEVAHWLQGHVATEIGEPVILVGHSMGGYMAMEYLRMFPNELRALCLFHSHVFGDTEEKRTLRSKAIRFVKEHGGEAYLKNFIPDLFGERYRSRHSADIQSLIDRHSRVSPDVLATYLSAMAARLNTEDLLRTSHVPVQFISGTEDAHTTYEMNLRQAVQTPQGQIIKMEGIGHMGMLEDAKGSIEALTKLKKWIEILL